MGTFFGLLGATEDFTKQVMTAYADAHIEGEAGYRLRQLYWLAPYAVTPATWYAAMQKATPDGYNEFNAKKVYKWLAKFPDARVWAAREGSVSLFVQPPLDHEPGGDILLKAAITGAKRTLRADEVEILSDGYDVREYIGNSFKTKGSVPGPVLRVWWD
jgi:hypothetical protein